VIVRGDLNCAGMLSELGKRGKERLLCNARLSNGCKEQHKTTMENGHLINRMNCIPNP
jgi:hypothetical protein